MEKIVSTSAGPFDDRRQVRVIVGPKAVAFARCGTTFSSPSARRS